MKSHAVTPINNNGGPRVSKIFLASSGGGEKDCRGWAQGGRSNQEDDALQRLQLGADDKGNVWGSFLANRRKDAWRPQKDQGRGLKLGHMPMVMGGDFVQGDIEAMSLALDLSGDASKRLGKATG